MKALILAAGEGKRLGEGNKCMLEVGGKPILEYNLDRAAEVGDEVIIVVGNGEREIVNRYGHKYKGKKVLYIQQGRPKGLVHAIECAEVALEGHDFFLMLGDEMLWGSRHIDMLEEFERGNTFGVCGICLEVPKEIRKTYSVEFEGSRIIRLEEKPRKPKTNLMGTGHCIFRSEILAYIEVTPISVRGEKELVDLIMCAVKEGRRFEWYPLCDKYINVNVEEDLERARSYYR